jgi:DNA-binding FrmR family transcriptional regulator
MEDSKEVIKDLLVRIRRVEGQVKGIERMIDNEVCCRDILVQVAAIRAAVNKVGGIVLENYAKKCLAADLSDEANKNIEQLVSTLMMFMK